MESSTFDRLTRMIGSSTRRRTALAATATGLAALTAGTTAAQDEDGKLSAAARRRARRGRRGKRGKKGPRAGSAIELVSNTCSNTSTPASSEIACAVNCPTGFVASGGGFNVGSILEDLGTVRHSEPTVAGGKPVGWSVTLEYFNLGQTFDYSVYAVCIPG